MRQAGGRSAEQGSQTDSCARQAYRQLFTASATMVGGQLGAMSVQAKVRVFIYAQGLMYEVALEGKGTPRQKAQSAMESDSCHAGRGLNLHGNDFQSLDPSIFQDLSSLE